MHLLHFHSVLSYREQLFGGLQMASCLGSVVIKSTFKHLWSPVINTIYLTCVCQNPPVVFVWIYITSSNGVQSLSFYRVKPAAGLVEFCICLSPHVFTSVFVSFPLISCVSSADYSAFYSSCLWWCQVLQLHLFILGFFISPEFSTLTDLNFPC